MIYQSPDDQDEGDVQTGTRACRACGARKPMAEFHWTASRRHRSRTCKTCAHAQQAERISERRKAGTMQPRTDRLRREYGLTPEAVETMRLEQDGACAICTQPFGERVGERMHIDHCHETGRVRALLCHNCNLGLGHFRDKVDLLVKAAGYLTQHRERLAQVEDAPTRQLTAAERRSRRQSAALRQHRSDAGREALQLRSETYRGDANPSSRLNETAVREIRELYAGGGVSQQQLAEKFGVQVMTINLAVRRKTWAHVV